MRVAFRVATATALLILLLLAVLGYHITTVRRLERIHRELSTHQVRAILLSLEHRRAIERISDNVRKLAVTGDARYAALIEGDVATSKQRLRALQVLLPPRVASTLVAPAVRDLTEFRQTLPPIDRIVTVKAPSERESMTAPARERLEHLRGSTQALIRAADERLTHRVEHSARAVSNARRMAFIVFGAAFVLGVAAVLLTIIPINRRLRVLVDATRRVADENYLHVIETPAGDEFSKLTVAFNNMVRRLAELDQLKKNLISHVSHELRTPLASIQESQTLLLEELPGRLNADQKRLLEHNVASCSRLSRLISNLLDLSRMEAGVIGYELADHDARAVVRDVVCEVVGVAPEARMRIDMQVPEEELRIVCDRERLAQVVRNLLDNALKFSPPQSEIVVRALAVTTPRGDAPARVQRLAREHEALVQIEVCDEGPGLSEQEREKVFGRFYRVDNTGGAGRGIGLGLAICWEIVTAHGGAIWVEGNPAGGSRFCVMLPGNAVGMRASVA